jgi:membrane-associated protein
MMVFESFVDLVSSSPWTYAVILAVAALDAVLPLVPSEATVISAGVLAGAGDLQLGLVVAAGAAGAYAGDTSAYGLGRRFQDRLGRAIFRGVRGRRRRAWARRTLQRHGGQLILGARFIPGGRTATMVTAGLLRMRWARFSAFAGAAAAVWASYAALLGYLGGRAFEDSPILGLLVGFAVAVGIVVAVEAGRRVHARSRRAVVLEAPIEEPAAPGRQAA